MQKAIEKYKDRTLLEQNFLSAPTARGTEQLFDQKNEQLFEPSFRSAPRAWRTKNQSNKQAAKLKQHVKNLYVRLPKT